MKTTMTKCAAVGSVLIGLSVLSLGSTQPVHAADPYVEGALESAPIGERGVMASGAAEDTLKTCMARIPRVASAGQRMLAEQSCKGEEDTRKAIQSAPKF
ncbi:MAG: hypothetical protein OEY12_07370 [Nitrospira sp.]|nr:hypothetical protein [Nitrospira sp.]